jgi:hypothetical protein
LTGCTRVQVRSVPVALPLPPRPALAPVPAAAFDCPTGVLLPAGWMCMANGTYIVLVNRERALKTWGLQLEAIIQANNQHAADRGK